MTWTPKYQAGFLQPIIEQLMAIVQRDQRDALDWVGGTGILPSFVTYQFSPHSIPQCPGILITPGDVYRFDDEAIGTLHYMGSVLCAVAVQHQDQDAATILIQQYVRAVDAIFRTLEDADSLAQLYQAQSLIMPIFGSVAKTTSALQAGSVKKLFVNAHSMPGIRRRDNSFKMSVTLEIDLEVEEV
jgi:hypothetical protein